MEQYGGYIDPGTPPPELGKEVIGWMEKVDVCVPGLGGKGRAYEEGYIASSYHRCFFMPAARNWEARTKT